MSSKKLPQIVDNNVCIFAKNRHKKKVNRHNDFIRKNSFKKIEVDGWNGQMQLICLGVGRDTYFNMVDRNAANPGFGVKKLKYPKREQLFRLFASI